MAEPIVFISRSRIADGHGAAFGDAFPHGVDHIRASKPRTALFAAYLNASGSEVAIVHAFPDAAAMAAHFEGSEERASSASGILVPVGFEVYGPAPAAAIAQLRREGDASGATLELHVTPVGGFLRAPV